MRITQRTHRLLAAIRTILIADLVMSLDNVLAVAAAAKGNTLLNYAGVRGDLLAYVVDVSPHKQGRFLPGSRIPVVAESELRRQRPDFVIVLPWNLRDEIGEQLAYIGDWGGRLVTVVPQLRID